MTGQPPYNAFLRQLASNQAVGLEQRRLLSARQAVVLGREPSCEIVLDANLYVGVSRRHAEIRPINSTQSQGSCSNWEICDLNSANGTYVNERRLYGCQTLQVGDRIRLAQDGPEFIFDCQVEPSVVPASTALSQQQSSSISTTQVVPKFLTNLAATFSKAIRFAAWGAVGGLIAGLICVPFGGGWNLCANTYADAVVATSREGALFGVCLAVALLVAFSQYLKRGFQIGKALKGSAWIGLLAGGIGWGISDVIYISLGASYFTQAISWSVGGGLLGLGLSFRIPNLGRWRGTVGGLVGGLLGGGLFVFVGHPDVQCTGSLNSASHLFIVIASYLLGNAIVGFFIGLMIVIAEAFFQQAWLEIHYDSKDSRKVIIGPEPISIGSDPWKCIVYDRNAPPVALRYQLTQGRILCEDVPDGIVRHLQPGDRQTVGNLTVIVRTGGMPTQTDQVSSA